MTTELDSIGIDRLNWGLEQSAPQPSGSELHKMIVPQDNEERPFTKEITPIENSNLMQNIQNVAGKAAVAPMGVNVRVISQYYVTIGEENDPSAGSTKGKFKVMGEGDYHVGVEKDSDGTTTISGNITYETDNGVTFGANGTIDTEGNTSGSVTIGGKF